MLKIKVGDKVKVTQGKDKGQEGKVERVLPKKSAVIVDGINMYKKHVKGSQGQKGGIYDISRPLNFAKIALICPSCKKPTRIGFRLEKNLKERVCRKCGKLISTKPRKK